MSLERVMKQEASLRDFELPMLSAWYLDPYLVHHFRTDQASSDAARRVLAIRRQHGRFCRVAPSLARLIQPIKSHVILRR